MPSLTLLFIDDDNSLQVLAKAILSGQLFNVLTATSVKEAEKVLQAHHVDLIICDVMMPEEDGITFCARLRKGGNKVPMLILSAVGDPQVIARGLESGASDYLVKPFDIFQLQQRILNMIGQKPRATAAKTPPARSTSVPKFLGWFRR